MDIIIKVNQREIPKYTPKNGDFFIVGGVEGLNIENRVYQCIPQVAGQDYLKHSREDAQNNIYCYDTEEHDVGYFLKQYQFFQVIPNTITKDGIVFIRG